MFTFILEVCGKKRSNNGGGAFGKFSEDLFFKIKSISPGYCLSANNTDGRSQGSK